MYTNTLIKVNKIHYKINKKDIILYKNYVFLSIGIAQFR
ncbi:hypothetical protein FM106_23110 [Brachybacterium faecium]|nr:hypothetical protein FM106_23110 [Brachybacterium faecium]